MMLETEVPSACLSISLEEIRFAPAGAVTRVPLRLHWLRETAPGTIEAEFAEDLPGFDASLVALFTGTFRGTVTPDDDGWLRLQIFRSPEPGLSGLSVQAWAVTPVEETWMPAALAALEARCAAAFSAQYHAIPFETPLFEYVFDATAPGLAACQAACQGLLPPACSEHIRVNETPLTTSIGSEMAIELHLPFVGRKQWTGRAEALARLDVEAGEDGRLFGYTVKADERPRQKCACQSALALAAPLLFPEYTESFTLAATDCRTGEAGHLGRLLMPLVDAYGFGPAARQWIESAAAAGGSLTAALTVSVPGASTASWLRGPGERDADFFDVYSKVSIAVQQATRRWIPYAAFSDPGRYEDLATAYPLVFFAGTRPCSGQPRSDFAYDLVSPDSPGVARPWAARPLAGELAKTQQFLLSAGRPSLARLYAAWRAPEILAEIVRKPRLINSLLTGDAFFVDRFVRMGVEGRRLSGRLVTEPRKGRKELAAFVAEFATLLNRKLRRCYAGLEFAELGSILLVEATRALAGGGRPEAVLRVSLDGREQTFGN